MTAYLRAAAEPSPTTCREKTRKTADHKPFESISVTAGRLTLSYSSTTRAAAQ